jgi:hypothetical protein
MEEGEKAMLHNVTTLPGDYVGNEVRSTYEDE